MLFLVNSIWRYPRELCQCHKGRIVKGRGKKCLSILLGTERQLLSGEWMRLLCSGTSHPLSFLSLFLLHSKTHTNTHTHAFTYNYSSPSNSLTLSTNCLVPAMASLLPPVCLPHSISQSSSCLSTCMNVCLFLFPPRLPSLLSLTHSPVSFPSPTSTLWPQSS